MQPSISNKRCGPEREAKQAKRPDNRAVIHRFDNPPIKIGLNVPKRARNCETVESALKGIQVQQCFLNRKVQEP